MVVRATVKIISLHEGIGHDGYCSGAEKEVLPPRICTEKKTVNLSRRPKKNVLYPSSSLFQEIEELVTITNLEHEFGCSGSNYCSLGSSAIAFRVKHEDLDYHSRIICIVVTNIIDTSSDTDDTDDD